MDHVSTFGSSRLLAIVFIAAFAASIHSQVFPGEATDSGLGGTNMLTGTVYTPEGRLNRRIRVRLSTQTRGDRLTSTDDNGSFAFRGLTSGSYTILIEKEEGFETYTQAVDIIQLRGSPPQTYTVSIRLVPKGNIPPKPAVVDAALAPLSEKGRELYAASKKSAAEGNYKAASEALASLVAEHPKFVPGFNDLGVAYMKLGENEKAESAFRSALAAEPDAFAPTMNLGIVLVGAKKYAEAEPVLRKARKADERSAAVRYFLGQALANLGKFDEAQGELEAALKMGGDQMNEGRRILAIIYASKGQRDRAASELETYLKVNPKAADAEQLRASIQRLKAN